MKAIDWFLLRSWLWLAIGLHILWGTTLILFEKDASGVTAIAAMSWLQEWLFGKVNYQLEGAVMIVVSMMAACGLILEPHWFRPSKRKIIHLIDFAAVLPQQFILMASATGAYLAIQKNHYLDGTGPMPPGHLLNDQSIFIAMCLLHTVNLIYIYGLRFANDG